MALVTYQVQRSAGAVASLEGVPLGARVANALVAYVAYLRQTIWPAGLAVFYPWEVIPTWQAVAGFTWVAARLF